MYSFKPSEHGFNPEPPANHARLPRGQILKLFPIQDLPVGGQLYVPGSYIAGVRNYVKKFNKDGRGQWITRAVINEEADRHFFRVVRIA